MLLAAIGVDTWTFIFRILQTLCTRLQEKFHLSPQIERASTIVCLSIMFENCSVYTPRVFNSRVDVMPNDVQIKILKTQTVTRTSFEHTSTFFLSPPTLLLVEIQHFFHFPSLSPFLLAVLKTFPCSTFAPSNPWTRRRQVREEHSHFPVRITADNFPLKQIFCDFYQVLGIFQRVFWRIGKTCSAVPWLLNQFQVFFRYDLFNSLLSNLLKI